MDAYSTYCTHTYYLLDSTGNVDLSSSTSSYTFNQLTGELKIINFSAYFNENFKVKVKSTYIYESKYFEIVYSGKVNVLY